MRIRDSMLPSFMSRVKYGDLVVAVNKKVIIYIEKKDKQYEIAVADPLYKEQSLQLSMNGEQINIVFPSGDYSGSSVIKHITEKH